MKKRHITFMNVVVFGILVILAIGLFTSIYWLLWPYKTADIVVPVKILNPGKMIAPNEHIVMEVHITKYNLYPVTATNSILCSNGRIYVIQSMNPKGSATLPVGTYIRVQDSYSVLGDAEPGVRCHFTFHNEYQVNPIRVITKEWSSEEFIVK